MTTSSEASEEHVFTVDIACERCGSTDFAITKLEYRNGDKRYIPTCKNCFEIPTAFKVGTSKNEKALCPSCGAPEEDMYVIERVAHGILKVQGNVVHADRAGETIDIALVCGTCDYEDTCTVVWE